MPIYEYQCQKCRAHTEAFQKVSDKPLSKCPKCGGRLEKMISAPAIQFKGSGWYVTDYAKKSSSPGSGGDSGSKDKKDDKSKSDTGSKESSTKEGSSKEGSSKEGSSKEGPRRGSGRHK
jgi:putative FmdB family regulatory protein